MPNWALPPISDELLLGKSRYGMTCFFYVWKTNMSASIWRGWVCWAILMTCLTGCQGLFGTQGPPHDPLFLSKTPMSARAELAPPIAIAYLEPTVPLDPSLAKNAPVLVDHNGPPVPAKLTNRPNEQD
jgi:hypothetical protein